MTEREFIAALAEDQGVTRAKAEDIARAVADLIAESLGRGDRLNIGGLGSFELRPIVRDGEEKPAAAVRFRPSAELRGRLKLADLKWEIGDLCEECGKRPKKKDPRCSTCKMRRYRAGKETRT